MIRLAGERVALRPLVFEDVPLLTAIAEAPEVAEWWGDLDEGFPFTDEPDTVRLTITHDATVIGLIQYGEENEPDYRFAGIDIFLDPKVRGQGSGPDALRTLVQYLTRELGHHRITVDPAVDNAAAIRSYEKVGFEPVGVLRSAWRDRQGRWRDLLLMDLIVEEALPPSV